MKPELQHIALLEALGWHDFQTINGTMLGIKGPLRGWVPAPPLTLDLMAEAEEQAGFYHYPLREKFLSILMDVVKAENIGRPYPCATKEQRLEVFLKTKGLWQEKEQ